MRILISMLFFTLFSTVTLGANNPPKPFSFGEFTITPKITKNSTIKNCNVEQILPVLSGSKDSSLQKDINERFEEWAGIPIGEKKVPLEQAMKIFCADAGESDAPPSTFNSTYTILRQTDKYLSINFFQRTYAGGAHGDDGDECHLLNMENGEEINLAEFLDPTKSAEFLKVVQQGLKTHYSDIQIDDNDLKKALKKPMLCVGADGGAYVQFRKYEIMSGVNGAPQAIIDRKMINSLFLTDDIITKLFGSDLPKK